MPRLIQSREVGNEPKLLWDHEAHEGHEEEKDYPMLSFPRIVSGNLLGKARRFRLEDCRNDRMTAMIILE